MIFTVIGHLCKDILHLPTDESQEIPPVESYGGILYAVLTLANLMNGRDVLQPVFGVGSADYEPVMELLKKYKHIDASGVFRIKGLTNQVHIFYEQEKGSRIECSKGIAPPVPYNRIKPFLDADALLINMISGSDITLETLDYIRMETRERRVPIYFDFHALTLGIDQDFKRFPRSLTDWRRYDESTLINHLMPLMVAALMITRGDRGLTLITQDIHKKLTRHDIPAVHVGPTKDPTGCGDVFGAAYMYHFMKTKDSLVAATAANRIAAYKATFSGLDGFSDIPKNAAVDSETGK
jgi:sugar/nucleoside kinase (ribokinase family)